VGFFLVLRFPPIGKFDGVDYSNVNKVKKLITIVVKIEIIVYVKYNGVTILDVKRIVYL
jgi:hypothetical protein